MAIEQIAISVVVTFKANGWYLPGICMILLIKVSAEEVNEWLFCHSFKFVTTLPSQQRPSISNSLNPEIMQHLQLNDSWHNPSS